MGIHYRSMISTSWINDLHEKLHVHEQRRFGLRKRNFTLVFTNERAFLCKRRKADLLTSDLKCIVLRDFSQNAELQK